MIFSNEVSSNSYRTSPISNVTIHKNTVTFLNASGRHKVKLESISQRVQFVKWLLS